MDVDLLKKKIRVEGFTMRSFALRCGITEAGLHARLRRKSGFKASDIFQIRDILNLSVEEISLIFFDGK